MNPVLRLVERWQARQYRRTHGRDSYKPEFAAAIDRLRTGDVAAARRIASTPVVDELDYSSLDEY